MSTTSMAIFSNPLFATYSVYARNASIASRRPLRSSSRHHLSVPRHRLSTFGRRAFSVADPTVWNSLPDSLRDPVIISSSFRQLLKTDLFNRYSAHSAQSHSMLQDSALYECTIDIVIVILCQCM